MAMKRLHKICFLIVLSYLSLFAFIVGYDEAPDPGWSALLTRPQPEVAESENVWLYFIGLSAPTDIEPIEYAEALLKRAETSSSKDDAAVDNALDESAPRLEFVGEPLNDSTTKGSMLDYAAKHPREIVAYYRDNQLLLQRYQDLQKHGQFSEPIDYGADMPFPHYSLIRNAQRTALLRIAAQANRGDVTGALAGLQADAEFGRLLATEARTLISKLIAIALLRGDFLLAAEIGETMDLSPVQSVVVDDILRPFENGESSMLVAFEGETRYLLKMIEKTQQKNAAQSWAAGFFNKKNATMNRVYAASRGNINLSQMSPTQFFEKVRSDMAHDEKDFRIGLPFVYNPAGEILAGVVQSAGYANYIERGFDLEGMRRLAKLKVLSRRLGIPAAEMQVFLIQHAEGMGNPYTNEAMTWDTNNGKISYARVISETPLAIDLKRLQ